MLSEIFQDDSLIVFDKPPGLVVTSSDTHKAETLEDILRHQYRIPVDRGGIVHRLDKDTSGLIVVAKTEEALANLQSQFKERVVQKDYLALVHGWMEEGGVVNAAIGRNPGDREKFVVFENGLVEEGESDEATVNAREAVTEYRPIQKYLLSDEKVSEIYPDFNKIQHRKIKAGNYQRFTLVRCHPRTGRTHQIRVHLKYIGFPIVGDGKYAGRKTGRLDHRWCSRQFLHAARLEFYHPTAGKRLSFESKLPEDLEKVLANLETV